MVRKSELQREIEAYLSKGRYPFHMPGHKRTVLFDNGLPYAMDLTELPETDDLHDASGMLLKAMRRSAGLYGAGRTWYLVNGSSCGNLAGIFAMTRPGDEVIAARNCHRSVYHAAQLRNLRVHWLLPDWEEEFGIFGSVRAEEAERLLRRYPKSRALILTSPSYEGIVSDIESIAALCHERGVPLYVDEAHGAHFGLEREGESFFPRSAIQLGADLCVQSVHKTLPSLTQTAWLHWKSELISEREVGRRLAVFESSSPSYPLLLSLDSCTELLLSRGEELFSHWGSCLAAFERELAGLRNFSILKGRRGGSFFDRDPGKLLLHCKERGMSGAALSEALRERFSIETEMSLGRNCLAMTSPLDPEEAYRRLSNAMKTLDRELSLRAKNAATLSLTGVERGEQPTIRITLKSSSTVKEAWGRSGSPAEAERDVKRISSDGKGEERVFYGSALPLPESILSLGEAAERAHRLIPLRSSLGEISGEYLYAYPPGIPVLAPGERITEELLRWILRETEEGDRLRFSESGEESGGIFVCQ